MATRSNALSEITRFWLEVRHGCAVRESVPVIVPRGLADIDLLAVSPDLKQFILPSGAAVGPRLIVETKGEHDYDGGGRDFGKRLLADIEKLGPKGWVAPDAGRVNFSMLRQQHFEAATKLFGSRDFDRLFVVHALDPEVRTAVSGRLIRKRVHWLTVREIFADLEPWYRDYPRKSGLRNALIGDLFHLLFGYCNAGWPMDAAARNLPRSRA